MRAVAEFNLDSFDPDAPYLEDDGLGHMRARIKKTFRGEIVGQSTVEMLAARSETGSGYVALERISGVVNGKSGAFSLLHIGTMAGTEMWAKWPVVPGSGIGELRTIRGEGKIDIDAAGGHTFTLEYEV
jgi:uncharacterized protein DUF3224